MMRPWRCAIFALGCLSIVSLGTSAGAQTRQLKICVPDYSVGVMPFFIAKQNGYFAQEQMDVEVIAGEVTSAPWDSSRLFQFTDSTHRRCGGCRRR
jgi:ABC-type nitrate/sulfonate/bicarbonate transport system substrate-binding protein